MKDLTKHNVALNDSLPQIGQLLFSLERSVNAILNEESRLKNNMLNIDIVIGRQSKNDKLE